MKIGVNTWVWTSPLTNDELTTLVPHIAQLGFDWVELPLETPGEFDYATAATLVHDHNLGVSTVAAMSPDRDLIHPDESIRANGMAYIRDCIQAAHAIGATTLAGPIYAAVGRTWQQTADERAHDTDLLVSNLGELAKYAADHGVVLCIEPLNRFETSFLNLADQAITIIDRVGHPSPPKSNPSPAPPPSGAPSPPARMH